jgi:hypothetical protein
MQLSEPTTMRPAERRLVHEGGFSMFLVIMVMFVSSMFVAAGFAAANGDLPLSGNWRDRKTAYAAAEAGLNFYQYHLDQDSDYWLKCTTVSAPNGSEVSPVNQAWDGANPKDDPRQWRKIAGSEARYTIELLPAPGHTTCDKDDQESMIDPATGTFRIRVTGQAYAGSKVKRSIVASFRRKSFLDFLWFTHLETTDPKNYPPGTGTGQATWAATNCNVTRPRNSSCIDINFVTGDWMHGPMHTDDNFLICGQPTFGRNDGDHDDVIEAGVANPAKGWVANTSGSCSGTEDPLVYPDDTIDSGVQPITLPTTNSSLKSLAKSPYSFVGKTVIELQGDKMLVTNTKAGYDKTQLNLPDNGVVYVDNPTSPACTPIPPYTTNYDDTKEAGCGNLWVGGHSSKSLTLAAKNDVIVTKTAVTPGDDGNPREGLIRDDDSVMLGLIADNFVRIQHPVSGSANVYPPKHFEIDAAILALSHSFTVDNYTVGAHLGDLTIKGGIAQLYRGAVGQGGASGSGYLKDYWYDDRLKYQTPPYFLQPVAASWHVMRRNELVPAR